MKDKTKYLLSGSIAIFSGLLAALVDFYNLHLFNSTLLDNISFISWSTLLLISIYATFYLITIYKKNKKVKQYSYFGDIINSFTVVMLYVSTLSIFFGILENIGSIFSTLLIIFSVGHLTDYGFKFLHSTIYSKR